MTQAAMTNRHPADQLADVRAQIAALKEREETLRHGLLLPGADLLGDEYVVEIATSKRVALDGAAVRMALGDERLKAWLKETETRSVRLKSRTLDEENDV